jgi:hypothetical protein
MVDSKASVHSMVNATSSGRAAVLFMSNRIIIVQSSLRSNFLEHVVRVIEFRMNQGALEHVVSRDRTTSPSSESSNRCNTGVYLGNSRISREFRRVGRIANSKKNDSLSLCSECLIWWLADAVRSFLIFHAFTKFQYLETTDSVGRSSRLTGRWQVFKKSFVASVDSVGCFCRYPLKSLLLLVRF